MPIPRLVPLLLALATSSSALAFAASGSSQTERFLIVRPAKRAGTIALHESPGGRVRVRLVGKTAFGSPLALSVARVRGRWLGVRTDTLPNGRLGWIDGSRAALRSSTTRLWLEADLSSRELLVHRATTVLRRIRVAVGRSGSPTPTGRFAVTDKIPGAALGGGFGCCVLALTGHQTHLPRGWIGGDRLAIHGGDESTLGRAVSAGCLHASRLDLRLLMRVVPLGTPVVIHP